MKLKSDSILDSWLTHVATDVHPSCQCRRWLEYLGRCRSIGYSPQRLWPQTNNHQQYFCYFGLKKGTWISKYQVFNGEYVSRGWPSPAADGQCSQLLSGQEEIVLMNRQNCPAWLLYGWKSENYNGIISVEGDTSSWVFLSDVHREWKP